jgi:hypothetical protein
VDERRGVGLARAREVAAGEAREVRVGRDVDGRLGALRWRLEHEAREGLEREEHGVLTGDLGGHRAGVEGVAGHVLLAARELGGEDHLRELAARVGLDALVALAAIQGVEVETCTARAGADPEDVEGVHGAASERRGLTGLHVEARADVDDAAITGRLAHARQEEVREEEGREVVHREGVLVAILREPEVRMPDARVVHEDVQTLVAREHRGGERAHVGQRREVRTEDDDVGGEGCHRGARGLELGGVAADDAHREATTRESEGRREADASARAGDEGDTLHRSFPAKTSP